MEISVQDTSAEALYSKISAINKGYMDEKYVDQFIKGPFKKDVLINRGYWVRYNIVNVMIHRFLDLHPNQPKQIINLGCGYDTFYFNLISNEKNANLQLDVFEIDLSQVVTQKIKCIQNSASITKLLGKFEVNKELTSLKTKNYKLFKCDISNLNEVQSQFKEFNVKPNIPTLIFAECVFTYIETKCTNQLLEYFTKYFDLVHFLNYEMYNPNDQFGKMMVKNFQSKGCPLVGIYEYPSLDSQLKRMKSLHYQHAEIYDMLAIYRNYCDQQERKRIEKIEFMDEYEEWNIMLSHYFVSFSSNIKQEKNVPSNQEFVDIFNKVKINMQLSQ